MSSACQPVLCMATSNEQVLLAVVTVRDMPGRSSPSLPNEPKHAFQRLVV